MVINGLPFCMCMLINVISHGEGKITNQTTYLFQTRAIQSTSTAEMMEIKCLGVFWKE